MKKFFIFTGILLLSLFIITGCSSNEEEKDEKVVFEDELTQEAWDVDFMGYTGSIKFEKDGKGQVTLGDSQNANFTYSVSNISDDGKEAEITVNGTGFTEIDGKTAKAKIVSDGLQVTANGISVILRPDNETNSNNNS